MYDKQKTKEVRQQDKASIASKTSQLLTKIRCLPDSCVSVFAFDVEVATKSRSRVPLAKRDQILQDAAPPATNPVTCDDGTPSSSIAFGAALAILPSAQSL